jgi:hypothetical protein
MALKLFKKFREALGLSRYRVAKDLDLGTSAGWSVKQIEETSKTYNLNVLKYLIKMGRELGKTDRQINNDILAIKVKDE